MPVTDVKTAAEFDALLASSPHGVVAHYWATWCEPCGAMDQLMKQLSVQYNATGVAFARVEAEEVDELTERYDVSAVPFFTFHKGVGVPLDKLEGADGKALSSKTQQHFGVASAPPQAANGGVAPVASNNAGAGGPGDLDARLRTLTTQDPVVLFMKGDRDEPRCGFSRKVVEALNNTGLDYSTFDILTDEDVRQGLKTFSNWPTYPQLYAGGELLGGCDIILEMAAGNELKGALEEAVEASKPVDINARLSKLVKSSEVMLFMKGDRDEPRCGFSRKVVEALNGTGVGYSTFDILTDEDVRQGLKEFSNWPTYPQLYHKGELLGGCDIILEMAAGGELKEAISA